MTDQPNISGLREAVEQLGSWPSFHDAEVVELELRRDAPSMLVLLLADHAERTQRTRVEFTLTEVVGLELVEFNEQNVVSRMHVEEVGAATVRLCLSPCYGLNGWIDAKGVDVRVLKAT